MTTFLSYIEHLQTWQKLVWVFMCLSFAMLVEGVFPLFRFGNNKTKHARFNLTFLMVTLALNGAIGLLTIGLFAWLETHQIGFLSYLDLPVWASLLIAVMFLDFMAQYVVHYMMHRVKWMWKVHMVHHSDTKVDATTGTRHHPIDYILREFFAFVAVMMTGAPISYYLFYRLCTVFFAYMTHTNLAMPPWLDRTLSWVFVTPNMHKFHHHFERPWTDTNFGNIFSFWDRIFGTLVYDDPKKVKYGLDVLDIAQDENLIFQLKIPFDNRIKTDY
jgi:sterol desaturase/sphingolipid hydroxylase (fatty acid hydroxylase superfamily)